MKLEAVLLGEVEVFVDLKQSARSSRVTTFVQPF